MVRGGELARAIRFDQCPALTSPLCYMAKGPRALTLVTKIKSLKVSELHVASHA